MKVLRTEPVRVMVRRLPREDSDGWIAYLCRQTAPQIGYSSRSIWRRRDERWPALEDVAESIIAFNDATRQGISGRGAECVCLAQRYGIAVYVVQARIMG